MKDERGLLGSLPKTRPGVESPRRAAARTSARAPGAGPAQPGPAEAGPEPAPASSSGIEDLARAGFGLATGAAAAGLKLAGRAAGEIGKAVGGR
jgi:hypothetical protein